MCLSSNTQRVIIERYIMMARQREEVLADFDALNSNDYDFRLGNFEGQNRVQQLCDELLQTSQLEQAIPTLFATFERLPDADFGTPGVLVSTLEELPDYETELVLSIRRKPTYYTVWMLNRILNGLSHDHAAKEQSAFWLNLILEASTHPLADEAAKEEAQDFIAFQQTRMTD